MTAAATLHPRDVAWHIVVGMLIIGGGVLGGIVALLVLAATGGGTDALSGGFAIAAAGLLGAIVGLAASFTALLLAGIARRVTRSSLAESFAMAAGSAAGAALLWWAAFGWSTPEARTGM